jgi:hypothetical protein
MPSGDPQAQLPALPVVTEEWLVPPDCPNIVAFEDVLAGPTGEPPLEGEAATIDEGGPPEPGAALE